MRWTKGIHKVGENAGRKEIAAYEFGRVVLMERHELIQRKKRRYGARQRSRRREIFLMGAVFKKSNLRTLACV